MAQNGPVRSTLAVSYCTSMSRPDAALALAAIQGFEGRRLTRSGVLCVAGSGLNAAIYCDLVRRFYLTGAVPASNDMLPVGLDLPSPLPPDPPMLAAALERRNAKGDIAYARAIRRVSDTAQAEAVLRNGVTLTPETALVLSAPATALARCLDLQGVKELFTSRVLRLVIVDAGELQRDVASLRKLLREWPTPVVVCGRGVGDGLWFPGASIATDFAWADTHPVVDVYRAFRAMPYDAPSYDLAAVHYAAQPDSGFFQTSPTGTITVEDSGALSFTRGAGSSVVLSVNAERRSEAIRAFVEIASARPSPKRG